jgi:Ca2+/H+ antiporter
MGQPRRIAFLHLNRSSRQVVVLDLRNFQYDLVMVAVDDAAKIVGQIVEKIAGRIGEATGTVSRRVGT